MKSGIYMITCVETNKVYIGSSKNMKSRYQVHLSDLKRGKHGNPYMINAFKKYGKCAFKFSIIEHCEPNDLLDREYFWMNEYESTNPDKGFNIIFDSKREKKHHEVCNSEIYRENMRQLMNKRWKDPEYAKMNIEAIQKAHEERKEKGIPLACQSEEAKKKSYESCHRTEFLEGLSQRSKKQLQDPEQRKIALKNLEEGRNNALRLENLRKAKQDPEYKRMIAEKTKASWSDPEKKAKRVENIKLALAMKKQHVK